MPVSPSSDEFPLANWNGTLMSLDEVRVPALDRSFLFGDAVYEALRVYEGRAFLLDRHMARLEQSLSEVAIGCSVELISERILDTLRVRPVKDGLLYIQITRGADRKRSHAFPGDHVKPNVLLWVSAYPKGDPHSEERRVGVSAITYPDLRWARRDIKTVNLLGNCMAADAAKKAGSYDAILVDDAGQITEGSHTSVFFVHEGVLRTTPSSPKILPGVTRALVLELANHAGITLEDRSLTRSELPEVSEAFFTGTTTEVLSIVTIDGRSVGDGRVGPVTRQLASDYRSRVSDWLSEQGVFP